MTAARIRKVRFKSGLTVDVLRREEDQYGENPNGKIIQHAREVAEQIDVAGFVVMGVSKDGTCSVGWHCPDDMGPALFQTYMAEILRREITTVTRVQYMKDKGEI